LSLWAPGARFESAQSHLDFLFGSGLLIKKMLTFFAFSKPTGRYILSYTLKKNKEYGGLEGI
jgi:hypothetical protein